MSSHSVAYDGQIMTLGQSLDENFRGVQKLLNDLHVLMRQMAMCMDQEIDEDDDYKESVLYEDQQCDIITRMVFLLEELIPMAHTITRPPLAAGNGSKPIKRNAKPREARTKSGIGPRKKQISKRR